MFFPEKLNSDDLLHYGKKWEDEKICVKDCPDFYGEYIHQGNICSDSARPSNAAFHYYRFSKKSYINSN